MVNDILGLPTFMPNVGDCYPIPLLNYPLFQKYSWILKYDKRHTYLKSEETTELEAILFNEFICDEIPENIKGNDLVKYKIEHLIYVISIVTKKNVYFDYRDIVFYIGDDRDKPDGVVNRFNYDEFKELICKQNLIATERFYKNKKLAERVKTLKKSKSEKGGLGWDDVISTTSILAHVSYEEISKFTYYQMMHTFGRANKIMEYKLTIQRRLAGDDKCEVVGYTDELKLGANDEDDKMFKKVSDLQKMFS